MLGQGGGPGGKLVDRLRWGLQGLLRASRGNPRPLGWPCCIKIGAVGRDMGGSQAVVAPGFELGLSCSRESLGIELGVKLTP